MEDLVESIDAFDPFSETHDDFATAVPSAARQFKLDGEGLQRVLYKVVIINRQIHPVQQMGAVARVSEDRFTPAV